MCSSRGIIQARKLLFRVGLVVMRRIIRPHYVDRRVIRIHCSYRKINVFNATHFCPFKPQFLETVSTFELLLRCPNCIS